MLPNVKPLSILVKGIKTSPDIFKVHIFFSLTRSIFSLWPREKKWWWPFPYVYICLKSECYQLKGGRQYEGNPHKHIRTTQSSTSYGWCLPSHWPSFETQPRDVSWKSVYQHLKEEDKKKSHINSSTTQCSKSYGVCHLIDHPLNLNQGIVPSSNDVLSQMSKGSLLVRHNFHSCIRERSNCLSQGTTKLLRLFMVVKILFILF